MERSELATLENAQALLDDYTLLVPIGSGSQGDVYSAIQNRTGREFALKMLKAHRKTEVDRTLFASEVLHIQKCRHPNIALIYDYSVECNRPWYTMDCVQGLNILTHCQVHELGVAKRVALFMPLCHAIYTAHTQGILHRDLKPTNMIVSTKGRPYVVDFGLSLAFEASTPADQYVCGTVPYMAPEVLLGYEHSTQSEIYCLGVILYELLTDRLPYDRDGERQDLIKRITSGQLIPFATALHNDRERLFEIPQDLTYVVEKALRKDPVKRYSSVKEFSTDIEAALAGQAITARGREPLYVLRKSARTYRSHLLVALVFLAGAVWVGAHFAMKAVAAQRTALAAVQLRAYIDSGDKQRDAGNIFEAETLFQTAISIARESGLSDPIMRKFAFDAQTRLGELMLSEGRTSEAEIASAEAWRLSDAGIGVTEDTRRLISFGHRLSGLICMKQKKYDEALKHFSQSLELRRQIFENSPGDVRCKKELISVQQNEAKCLRKMGRLSLAMTKLTSAHESLLELVRQYPDHHDLKMRLAHSHLNIGNCLMLCDDASSDNKARENWIRCREILNDKDLMHHRRWEANKILDAVERNLASISERN